MEGKGVLYYINNDLYVGYFKNNKKMEKVNIIQMMAVYLKENL